LATLFAAISAVIQARISVIVPMIAAHHQQQKLFAVIVSMRIVMRLLIVMILTALVTLLVQVATIQSADWERTNVAALPIAEYLLQPRQTALTESMKTVTMKQTAMT
jgi:hypothetical protein